MVTLGVGTIAVVMVFPGLLLGRLAAVDPGRRQLLMGLSAGILLFLLVDLLGHARELPTELLAGTIDGGGGMMSATIVLLGLALGLVAGWLSVSWLEAERLARREELGVALSLAVGVGAYNFLQGMSLGQAGRYTAHSAVSGDGLLELLLVGLLVQNAAKGLAIAVPIAGRGRPVPWSTLLGLGAIAGLPTLGGAVLGITFWNPQLFVALFGIAAGMMAHALWRLVSLRPGPGRARLASAIVGGFVLAVIATFALEISHYSLPELMSSYWL